MLLIFFSAVTISNYTGMKKYRAKKAYTLVFTVLLSGILFCSGEPDRLKPVADGEPVWFDNMYRYSAKFRLADADAIFRSVTRGAPLSATLPPRLREDRSPCILFISIRDGSTPARVRRGSGAGFSAALNDCAEGLVVPTGDRSGLMMRFDLVRRVFPPVTMKNSRSVDRRYFHRTSMGMALDREAGVALLPGEVNGNRIIDTEGIYSSGNLAEYLDGKGAGSLERLKLEKIRVRPFVTETFFYSGNSTERLYRDHNIYRDITPDVLYQSAVSAGEYLVRSTRKDGSFDYSFDPVTGEVADEYNIIRHAGTVFAMLHLHEMTKENELLDAGARAVRYLDSRLVPFKERRDALCLCQEGRVHLGGAALAILAMDKYFRITGENQYLERMQKLARYLVLEQRESGRFIHARRCRTFWRSFYRSPYYPGEAILALLTLYEIDRNKQWLRSAEKGARYLILDRDAGREREDLSHDHWLLMALEKLYRHRPDIVFLNHAMKLANSIVIAQNRDRSIPDIVGSYYTPPGSTPTATRSEGLIAAYRLVRDRGRAVLDKKKYIAVLKEILETVHLNIHFQLNCQYDRANTFFLANPDRARGGFRVGLGENTVRIDFVQHNLSALIGLHEIVKKQPDMFTDPRLVSYRLLSSIWLDE